MISLFRPFSKPGKLTARARRILEAWDAVMKPQGYPPYFEHPDPPPFHPASLKFDPGTAWWLSELCRLVYTPDHREGTRPWSPSVRHDYLEDSVFRETASFHRTGCHAAIFEARDPSPGTEKFSVVCFRGTSKIRQWLLNLTALPEPFQEDKPDAYVHKGFKLLFDSLWPEVEAALEEVQEPLLYTGHSLGAAFATLAAARRRPYAMYTFGSPRVGNNKFLQPLEDLLYFRVVNHHDLVTLVPDVITTDRVYPFHHLKRFIYLDENGGFHENPTLEELGPDGWQPRDPLKFLTQSFRTPHPPDCIMDHSPIRYVRHLAMLSQKGKSGTESSNIKA